MSALMSALTVECTVRRGGSGTGRDPSPKPGDLDPCIGDEGVRYLSMPEVQVSWPARLTRVAHFVLL